MANKDIVLCYAGIFEDPLATVYSVGHFVMFSRPRPLLRYDGWTGKGTLAIGRGILAARRDCTSRKVAL